MDEYVRELGANLESSFDKDCKVIYETSPVTLGIKKAIPTALLLNELLTNAFRFLSSDPGGKIEVILAQEEGHVVLQVTDNGPGLPEEYDLDAPETLGLSLVRVLIQQLQATFELDRENGTSFRIKFSNGGQILKTA